MTDDAAFLATIKAAPGDNMPRLVYADWLDEQGRPGGEFLRVDCELAALDTAEFERQEQVRVFERQEQERAKLGEDGVIDSAPPDLLGAYYWQRVHLIAKMRCVIRGLADEWMAAVSRVPIEEINARVREIQSLLRRRVTVAEVLGQMTEWDKPPEPRRGLWLRVRRLFGRAPVTDSALQTAGRHVRYMREWIETNLRPGDELWEYDTAGNSWAHMCGEMGYAIVRNGKVVEFEMLMEN